jgi:cell division protein FtsI/penicillin-binding protein 2
MYHFRIRAMLIVIFGALLMVATRLFYLQIIEGRRYEQYAENVRLATHTLPTLRGRIFSADGVLLAADLPAFDIGVRYDQLDPPVPHGHARRPAEADRSAPRRGAQGDPRARCLH